MNHLTRREFLKVAGLSGAGIVLISCQSGAEAPAPAEAPAAPAANEAAAPAAAASARGFIESPMLAERVAAGTLPPIDERMPQEAFVVGPGVLLQEEFQDWQDGKHGGTITVAAIFPTPFTFLGGGGTILRSPGQTTGKALPNVVSAFSHSDDYKTFQFTIRKGLKWSDGTPVTTEDVRFPMEDMYGDPDAQRPWPPQLYAQGKSELGPATLKIMDDFTFELSFSEPYGFLVADLNSWIPNYELIFKPAHYLKQFHAKYAKEDELAALLEENSATSWQQLLQIKDVAHWSNGEARALGMPVLLPWVLTQYTEERTVFERNPYYWHVDALGQQLPYIDTIINNRSVDRDAQVNATLAGQVDLAVETDAPLNKMAVYQQNAEQGGYRIFTTGSFNYPLQLFLNHDYQYEDANSSWQRLVADPNHNFGKAIAAAIDAVDNNNAVFFGMFGEPFLNTTKHDPELAKQLLDEAGLTKLDADNFRLDLDGNPFVFRISYPEASVEFNPIAELLKEQLEAVGIRVELDPLGIDWGLYNQRKAANEIMASILWNDGTAWESGISEDYLPAHKGAWSPMTWQYFTTSGKEGRQPPEYLQKFYDLHSNRKAFPPDSPEGKDLFAQMMKWFEENYVLFPCTGLKVVPNIVDKQLQNTQKEGAPYELDSYLASEGYWFAA
jgi:peptide/nickel transport system substrate-binding protein